MKRSRSEFVHTSVGRYLKRRQYTESDTYKKSDLKLQHSLSEMSLSGVINNEIGKGNTISFSSVSGDATAIDQQFARLRNFIAEASEPYKSQLTYLLFPMFVHMHLELIANGHKTAAQKFHMRHHVLFMSSSHYKPLVECLSKVVSIDDIAKNMEVKNFRENKYSVRLTEDCLDYLQRFLKDNDHLMLLQILNLFIDVEVQLSEHSTRLHLYEDGLAKSDALPYQVAAPNDSKSQHQNSCKEDQIVALKEIIKKVQEGPPCLPSVGFYTLYNSFYGACCADLSSNNSILGVGGEDSSVRLWGLVPGAMRVRPHTVDVSKIHLACDELPEEEDTREEEWNVESRVLRGHGGAVYGLSFVPETDVFLTCSADTTVRAWDVKTHNRAIYRGHGYPIWDIDVSPFGLYFATGSMDRTARLWSLDRTYPLRIFAGHNMDIDCVKFHPNCNYLATGSLDRTIRLWSVQDGSLVRIFQGHRAGVLALAFSPDGKYLASAGDDRRIRLWDIGSGSLIKELRGHTDVVYSLCFNRDGEMLASCGQDSVLRLWDVRKSSGTETAAVAVTGNAGASGGSSSGVANPSGGGASGGTGTGGALSNSTESHNSPELIGMYTSKVSPLILVKFIPHNVLVTVASSSSSSSSSNVT